MTFRNRFQIDRQEEGHSDRRHSTFGDRLARIGAQAGALLAVLAVVGPALAWGFNLLPFAMATEVRSIATRVEFLERATQSIQVDQKSTLELQLIERIATLDSAMTRIGPSGQDFATLRSQRNELQQRLDRVRRVLTGLTVGADQ
jgi:hypothetical protein